MSADSLTARRTLLAVVLAGAGLRALLVFAAENRLDSDEATVAVMALDILEGRSLPFFLYHASYNGGAAVEGYLAAAGFALFGVSGLVVKLSVLLLWTAAGALFADLCRRSLEGIRPFLAVLFFGLGTPFFLEWSVKARGGYEETLLLGVVLLWLGQPSRSLRDRPERAALAFGVVTGIGVWISEMILPLLPGALVWLFGRRERSEWPRMLGPLALGVAAGLAPLLVYNVTHDWSNAARSVVVRLFTSSGKPPLSGAHLFESARFVLGPAWPIIAAGVGVAALKLLRGRRRLALEHAALATVAIYVVGYWLAGLRYLAVPPSRVLFPVYPFLALLLAAAAEAAVNPRRPRGALALAATALGVALTLAPLAGWMASGAPREMGSWRSDWALVDAEGLHRELASAGADLVYASHWTAWPLRFEIRRARRLDPSLPAFDVEVVLPKRAVPGRSVAFVVHEGAPDRLRISAELRRQEIAHARSSWGPFAIFSGIDSARVATGRGFPDELRGGAIPAPRGDRGSFN